MTGKMDRIAFGLFALAVISLTFSEAASYILFGLAVVASVVHFKTR
ncbi:MAG: hypothetical protein AAF641_06095 [Pseudomonadota bacterium]